MKLMKIRLNKGYLTWFSRSLMEKQKNDYEYYMYIEHDIKFSENNFNIGKNIKIYYLKKNFI